MTKHEKFNQEFNQDFDSNPMKVKYLKWLGMPAFEAVCQVYDIKYTIQPYQPNGQRFDAQPMDEIEKLTKGGLVN